MANLTCDGSCGGHQENLGTGCLANRADNTASDDSIFPWRDLYPLAGQRILHGGEEWLVLKAEKGGSFRKLWREFSDGSGDVSKVVDKMECRPLTWTLLDELTVELQGYTDAFAPGATVILAWPEDPIAYLDSMLSKEA
jgi:hypothetical protein